MPKKVKAKRCTLFAIGMSTLFSVQSNGAITLTFTEEGNGVVLRANGTLNLSNATFDSDLTRSGGFDNTVISTDGVFSELLNTGSNSFADRFRGIDLLSESLASFFFTTVVPSSGTTGFTVAGSLFWAFSSGDGSILDDGIANVVSYSVDRTITWEDEDYLSLGLNTHTTDTHIDLWATRAGATDDEKVRFIVVSSSVPEPSSTLLLGLGMFALASRRSRI